MNAQRSASAPAPASESPAGLPAAGSGGLLTVPVVLVSAAFCKELFYRGFLLERLGRWLGRTRPALAGSVVLAALVFAAAHFADQGLPGAMQAAITGSVFVVIIYRGWEAPVAEFSFR